MNSTRRTWTDRRRAASPTGTDRLADLVDDVKDVLALIAFGLIMLPLALFAGSLPGGGMLW